MVFSFTSRKKQVDLAPHVRRIIDLTTPNRPTANDQRFELRYNRTMPVLMHPWNGRPDLEKTSIGITRDLSDRGLGLIAIAELKEPQYVVSLWPRELDEPYHFICWLRDFRALSLGMWNAGFQFEDLIKSAAPKWSNPLTEIAEKALLPFEEESCTF